MTGKKSLRDAPESCRAVRGSAERGDVTGPRVFPLRRRRLGGNGFPHRYQRGGIRPGKGRADAGSGHGYANESGTAEAELSSLRQEGTKAFFVDI